MKRLRTHQHRLTLIDYVWFIGNRVKSVRLDGEWLVALVLTVLISSLVAIVWKFVPLQLQPGWIDRAWVALAALLLVVYIHTNRIYRKRSLLVLKALKGTLIDNLWISLLLCIAIYSLLLVLPFAIITFLYGH